MESPNINSKDIIFALDIGTRSIIGTVGIVKEKKFHCLAESYIEHNERAMMDGQIHDINLVASEVNIIKKQLEKQLGLVLEKVSIAAAGRFLRTTVGRADIQLDSDRAIDKELIRSIELTAVRNAEEQINEAAKGKLYCVGHSVKNYNLNDYVIGNLLSHKGDKISAEVIATFLPRSVVESLYSVMEMVKLSVTSLTLEPIAAMEAAVPKSLRLLNLALVDIGAGTSDIAISSQETISAYGMVSTAGDEVTETIAQNLLVDFNTAQRIKKECSVRNTVMYTDVLGLENEVYSEEIIKVIRPVVQKICDEIASKVIELNGGKSPNAVFLVGGGAHTPGLKEALAEKLNLSSQRIAIKGRESVADCICFDNSLGSIGVTVLGIALVSIMKHGQDFINVTLNDSVVSLLNSQRHTVADVMMQGGINPKVLIGKNGKNIRFIFNGEKRVAFGTLASSAHIKINGATSNIDSEIREGDRIEVDYAKNGRDAAPKLSDYIEKLNSISFFIDGEIASIEPIAFINGQKTGLEKSITEGDEVNIVFPDTIEAYRRLVDQQDSVKYFIEDSELNDDYKINEGDRITRGLDTCGNMPADAQHNNTKGLGIGLKDKNKQIDIVVNGKRITLNNKNTYIFIDVFDYISFDLTVAKGNLVLQLNGSKAGYHDVLSEGDEVKIYWEQ